MAMLMATTGILNLPMEKLMFQIGQPRLLTRQVILLQTQSQIITQHSTALYRLHYFL